MHAPLSDPGIGRGRRKRSVVMKILVRRRRYFADSVCKVLNKNNLAIFVFLFHLYPDLRMPD